MGLFDVIQERGFCLVGIAARGVLSCIFSGADEPLLVEVHGPVVEFYDGRFPEAPFTSRLRTDILRSFDWRYGMIMLHLKMLLKIIERGANMAAACARGWMNTAEMLLETAVRVEAKSQARSDSN